jgi:hypothetical protein
MLTGPPPKFHGTRDNLGKDGLNFFVAKEGTRTGTKVRDARCVERLEIGLAVFRAHAVQE